MSPVTFTFLAAATIVGGLAVVVLAVRLLQCFLPSQTRLLAGSFLLIYGVVLVLRLSAWPITDLAVLTGAVGGVLLFQGGLQTPRAVAVFLGVAAIVDVLSMSGGLSRLLIERYRASGGGLLQYLTLAIPIRGHAVSIVGIGDLLVGGAAATALLRLKLRPVPIMGTFAIGLLAALAYGLWRGRGAPALPFIAVVVFVLVWRHSVRASRQPTSGVVPPGDP